MGHVTSELFDQLLRFLLVIFFQVVLIKDCKGKWLFTPDYPVVRRAV